MKRIFLIVLIFLGARLSAQFPEYRITEDGRYEYLGNRSAADMVFDETQGTYYRPITIRTFFLQAQKRGYVPLDVTHDDFVLMTVDEQRTLIQKRVEKPLDCSIGQIISGGCITYKAQESRTTINGDNSSRKMSKRKALIDKKGIVKKDIQ